MQTTKVVLDEEGTRVAMRGLLNDDSRHEIVMRDKLGREGVDAVERLARELRLHFKPYGKGTNTVLVVSKVALPDYRADLDLRRDRTRHVGMSTSARQVVVAALDSACSELEHTEYDKQETTRDVTNEVFFPRTKQVRFEEKNTCADSASADAEFATRERSRLETPSHLLRTMQQTREKLPAHVSREAFLKTVAANQITVVSGETGCGKTTQLPQFVLHAALLEGKYSHTNIVCTQPRCISAVSVAARVAQERDEQVGDLVGYQIRGEQKTSRKTKLTFCTTGVLLRKLIANKALQGVTHIFVDEIHERGIHEDFLLIVLRDLCLVRKDLKVVLMSATLDAEVFSKYFGIGNKEFHVPGKTFPVRELFLEHVLGTTGFGEDVVRGLNAIVVQDRVRKRSETVGNRKFKGRAPPRPGCAPCEGDITGDTLHTEDPPEWQSYAPDVLTSLRRWRTNAENDDAVDVELVVDVLRKVVRVADTSEKADGLETGGGRTDAPAGAVLVFLTGWDDIVKVTDLCANDKLLGDASKTLVLPLHGSLPSSNQKAIFDRPKPGIRKIILATNIAETSITIEDVVYVIDCGKAKEKTYDSLNDMACLKPSWTSKASAHQRRGRAGRVRPGFCVRLYTSQKYQEMAAHATPEMRRMPLEELVLSVKSLGLGFVSGFCAKAIDPPDVKAVANAIALLVAIGAVTEHDESLTELGKHLAKLPVSPRLGKMLVVACVFGCVDPALTVAAAQATRNPFVLPLDKKSAADSSRREFAKGTCSDHVAIANAFGEWQATRQNNGYGASRGFCKRRFLSFEAMERIEKTRMQLRGLLENAGFAVARSSEYKNNNSGFDTDLFRAVVCAGLFPKIASIKKKGRRNELTTHEDGGVECHPNSVNSVFGVDFPHGWLVYGEKIKTQKVFVRDCTCVPTCSVLLLGGPLDVVQRQKMGLGSNDSTATSSSMDISEEDKTTVSILHGAYRFDASSSTIALILSLKDKIDTMLRRKAIDPGFCLRTNAGPGVIHAVKTLMAGEESDGVCTRDAFFYDSRKKIGGGGDSQKTIGGYSPTQIRPLDWPCPNGCGAVFASKQACFRCGGGKPR